MLLLLAEITPKPQSYTKGTKLFEVGPLSYTCRLPNNTDCTSMVDPVYRAYEYALFPKGKPVPGSASAALKTLSISLGTNVFSGDIVQTNESYSIVVNSTGIYANCASPDGIPRAFATLSQMIEAKEGEKYYSGKYAIYESKVDDFPQFHFRQLLVDTSRHFLPLSTLKRQVLGISMAKLNCLHIHIVDMQSNAFAAETKPADNMKKAAYVTGKPYLLTKNDIVELAKYARPLGVFLMVEYDMPGHATSWRMADPTLVADCPNEGYSSVNPTNELVYQYIDAYVRDVFETATLAGAIPVLHLGGDEVDHRCWNNDKQIAQYMQEQGLTSVTLWKKFHKRVTDIILAQNPKAYLQYWYESYENGNEMAPNAMVNFWTNTNEMPNCVSEGVYAVRTQGWYLDVLQPGSSHYMYQDSWQDMYKVDPYQNIPDAFHMYVLGGGTCIWGEYTDDGNLDDYVWPRAISPSEVLWTHPADRTINSALTARFNEFSCKLRQMGMRGGPIEAGAPCVGVDQPNPKYAK